jgi:hypothetical protein
VVGDGGRWCEQRRIGYALAVPRSQTIPAGVATGVGSSRADHAAAAASEQAWKRRTCGAGAMGPRLFDWVVASLPVGEHTPPGWGRWLLVRRQILTPDQIDAGKEPELAYYLCAGPPGTTDEDLIRVTGTRWAIEECFQTAKTEVGLDQYLRRCQPTMAGPPMRPTPPARVAEANCGGVGADGRDLARALDTEAPCFGSRTAIMVVAGRGTSRPASGVPVVAGSTRTAQGKVSCRRTPDSVQMWEAVVVGGSGPTSR